MKSLGDYATRKIIGFAILVSFLSGRKKVLHIDGCVAARLTQEAVSKDSTQLTV
jgi:hypothetical protein